MNYQQYYSAPQYTTATAYGAPVATTSYGMQQPASYTTYPASTQITPSQSMPTSIPAAQPMPSAEPWGDLSLTDQEKTVVATMSQRVASEGLKDRVTEQMTIQFLMARKFEIDRAMTLLYNHLQWKATNNIVGDNVPLTPNILRELESGRVIVPPMSRDLAGAQVIFFKPALLNASTTSNPTEFCVAVYYMLQRCIQDLRTQRLGFLFVCDLRGTRMTQVDTKLIRTILDMLSNKFPGRLRKVLLLEPPKFFRVAFRLIKPFIAQKYLDKMSVTELRELTTYVSPSALMPEYGGSMVFDQRSHIAQLQMDGQKPAQMPIDQVPASVYGVASR